MHKYKTLTRFLLLLLFSCLWRTMRTRLGRWLLGLFPCRSLLFGGLASLTISCCCCGLFLLFQSLLNSLLFGAEEGEGMSDETAARRNQDG